MDVLVSQWVMVARSSPNVADYMAAKEGNDRMIGTLKPSAEMQSYCRSLMFDVKRRFPSLNADIDLKYLLNRHDREGDRFFYTTLPLLGKAVEKALILEVPLQVPLGFKLMSHSRLPCFLGYLFQQIFDNQGNVILEPRADAADAVKCIRQICLLFSKVACGVEEQAEKRAVDAFYLRTKEDPDIKLCRELQLARRYLHQIFNRNTALIHELQRFRKNPWGRHGPGAVADKSSPADKWDFSIWPGIPERLFSFSNTVRPSLIRRLIEQPASRVIAVPKDFRGPRIICIEPKELQFAQQGIMDILYRLLPRDPYLRRSINFVDVTSNKSACFNREVATIDLKDASDHLSLKLGRLLLPRWVFTLVTRYRSHLISYKDQSWNPRCFATMGNAFCFPIQTLLFWALARAAVSYRGERKWRHSSECVKVFGDDIIVPRTSCADVVSVLERCGLVVNTEKTCSKTLVKESCGAWVYNGVNQNILRIKTVSIKHLQDWSSFQDYSVLAASEGFVSLSETFQDHIRERLPPLKRRYNRSLQRMEIRVPRIATPRNAVELGGCAGLYAWHVHNDTAPVLRGTWKQVKWRWEADV